MKGEDAFMGGFIVVIAVIGFIIIAVQCWMEERAFKQLKQYCTAEKVLSVLKDSDIHFGCYRAGVFVTDQSQMDLEVKVSRVPVPSENEKTTTTRKQPKDIYRAKQHLGATPFVIEFLMKNRANSTVVHAEFYRFRGSTTDEQSVNAFLQEWIAFFNDYRYQNDGEKQYFCHHPAKSEDVVQIDHGVTTYDAASTRLLPKVSISGNGKMIVHGNVTL